MDQSTEAGAALHRHGYVHVIAQPRGSAKSEGHYGHEDSDHYDLIEWITQQPWSDSKVGMGIRATPASNGVPRQGHL